MALHRPLCKISPSAIIKPISLDQYFYAIFQTCALKYIINIKELTQCFWFKERLSLTWLSKHSLCLYLCYIPSVRAPLWRTADVIRWGSTVRSQSDGWTTGDELIRSHALYLTPCFNVVLRCGGIKLSVLLNTSVSSRTPEWEPLPWNCHIVSVWRTF